MSFLVGCGLEKKVSAFRIGISRIASKVEMMIRSLLGDVFPMQCLDARRNGQYTSNANRSTAVAILFASSLVSISYSKQSLATLFKDVDVAVEDCLCVVVSTLSISKGLSFMSQVSTNCSAPLSDNDASLYRTGVSPAVALLTPTTVFTSCVVVHGDST